MTPRRGKKTSRRIGRPPEYGERVTTAIRFSEDIHTRLTEAALERDVSMNFLVVRAVEQFLDHLVPADEVKWTR